MIKKAKGENCQLSVIDGDQLGFSACAGSSNIDWLSQVAMLFSGIEKNPKVVQYFLIVFFLLQRGACINKQDWNKGVVSGGTVVSAARLSACLPRGHNLSFKDAGIYLHHAPTWLEIHQQDSTHLWYYGDQLGCQSWRCQAR